MGKKPNLQKWIVQILNLLVVAIATFSGEFLITRAAPSNGAVNIPTLCTLRNNTSGGTQLDIPASIPRNVASALGVNQAAPGISGTYGLNCSNNQKSAPAISPTTRTFTIGGITYNHEVSPAFSGVTQGPVKTDDPTSSIFHVVTVNNPGTDTVTWDFSSLNLSTRQCSYATHPYQNANNASGLQYKSSGQSEVRPSRDALQVVYRNKEGITKIELDFSGVNKGTVVDVGEFFVGGCP